VRPIIVGARHTWQNLVKGRKLDSYSLQAFIDAAVAVDPKYKGYTTDTADGKAKRATLRAMFNYCLLHDDAVLRKYRNYSIGAPDPT
jgi:hypothetical protein